MVCETRIRQGEEAKRLERIPNTAGVIITPIGVDSHYCLPDYHGVPGRTCRASLWERHHLPAALRCHP